MDRPLRARLALWSLLGLIAAGLNSDWIVETLVDGPAAPTGGQTDRPPPPVDT